MFCQIDRSFIRVSGPDCRVFLQGLITQDIYKPGPHYSYMLTPQGRFLYDFFIIPHDNSYLIDIEASACAALLKHLTMYKLRSAVSLEREERWQVMVSPEPLKPNVASIISFQDPRFSEIGWRSYTKENIFEQGSWDYYRHLMRLGVPEGCRDLTPSKSIPLECNAEELNAISFDKGCYLGQELTARTKHVGVVRKRLMPGNSAYILSPETILLIKETCEKLGTVQAVCQDTFLARIGIEKFLNAQAQNYTFITEQGNPLTFEWPKFLKRS